MTAYSISKTFSNELKLTKKAAAVMKMFGLTMERFRKRRLEIGCEIKFDIGDIVYITGPSGAGKSVILRELTKQIAKQQRINLEDIKLAANKTLVDCIGGDFLGSLRFLSTAGLNDIFTVLSSPANLSEGQKWRFRLACALAAGKRFILADEFCTNLDRVTAAVICCNIRKFAKHYDVTFILASSHEDTLADLEPDVIVTCELEGSTEVIYKLRAR